MLRWDFFDVAGNKEMAAYQVQIDSGTAFTAPAFDTGIVASDDPSLDLSTTTYAGLAEGARAYWRVRVQDGAGLWSSWSDIEPFRRLSKSTLTVTNPGAGNVFEEPTPPISWTFGGTQTAYQVIVRDYATQKNVWDSGRVTSTDNAATVPDKNKLTPNARYLVYVRVWDDKDREATPGDPPYVQVEKDVTFTPTSSVTPTTNLTAAQNASGPGVVLEWDSSTMPDSFVIQRDGKVVRQIDNPEDFLISGSTTRYRFIDRKVPGRQEHTWEVARLVNGRQSAGNATVTFLVRNIAPWLMRKDGTDAIALANAEIDPGLTEDSDVMFAQGGDPMLVTSALYGYVGTATGILAGGFVGSLTAKQQRDRFLSMREDLGVSFYFLWADEAIECYIYNTKIKMLPVSDGSTDYQISFGFIQVDR